MVAVAAAQLEAEDEDEDVDYQDPSQLVEINHSIWHQPQEEDKPHVIKTEEIEIEDDIAEDAERREDADEHSGSLLQKALLKRSSPPSENGHVPLPKHPRLPDPTLFLESMSVPSHLNQSEKEERRRFNQTLNSKPRDYCPICGDRANGIHYGIYTCEGCKNFFKRSAGVIQSGKPGYVCKEGKGDCDVSLFEDDGRTRRRTRCQFCRYEACLNQGMVHMGRTNVQTQPPQQQHQPHKHEESSTSSSSSEPKASNATSPFAVQPQQFEKKAQHRLKELREERLGNEVELLKSRIRELETSVAEKDAQLEIQRRQIRNLSAQNELLKQTKESSVVNGHCNMVRNGSGNGSVTLTTVTRK